MEEDKSTISEATDVSADEPQASGASVTDTGVEMETVTFDELFSTQPTIIQEYILDPAVDQKRVEIYKKAGLSDDEMQAAVHLEMEVFFGLIDPDEYPDILWSELTWDDKEEERAQALALDVLGNIFLPAQVFLGDVAAVIFSLGGNPDDYKVKLIDVRKLSYSEGVDGIVRALGDGFVSREELPRLRYLIETRLRGVRNDDDFKDQLMRAKKVGGLELSEQAADRVIEVIRVEMQLTAYSEESSKPATDGGDATEPEKPEFTPAKIKRLYSGSKEERDNITKRVGKFNEVTEKDPQKMHDAFYEVLYPPDLGPIEPDFVLAGLIALGEAGELHGLLGYDDRIKELMQKFYVDKGLEDEAVRFADNPTAPEFMNVFLQLMLRGFASFEKANAARFGLRIINLLKKSGRPEYGNLVAFDSNLGDFRWLDEIEF